MATKLGDFIKVTPPGHDQPIDIPRGNMSDNEWADIQNQVQKLVDPPEAGMSVMQQVGALTRGTTPPAVGEKAVAVAPPGHEAYAQKQYGNDPVSQAAAQSAAEGQAPAEPRFMDKFASGVKKLMPMEGGFPGFTNPIPMEGGFNPPFPNPFAGGQTPQVTQTPGQTTTTTTTTAKPEVMPVAVPTTSGPGINGAPPVDTTVSVKDPVTGESATLTQKTGAAAIPGFGSNRFGSEYEAEKKRLDQARDLEIKATENIAQVEQARLRKELEIKQKALLYDAQFEAQRVAAQQAYDLKMQQGERAYQDIVNERRTLLNQGVDPNRFWANKGIGGQIAAVIAGALFGYTGKGMDYITHIDSLIQNDIKLQQDELARKGGILSDMAFDTKNIIANARQRGLDALASVSAARAAAWDQVKTQLDISATEIGSETALERANLAKGAIDERIAKEKIDMISKQQRAAIDAQNAAIQAGFLQMSKDKFDNRDNFKGAAAGWDIPMTASSKNRNDLNKAVTNRIRMKDATKELRKALEDTSGQQYIPGTEAHDRVSSLATQIMIDAKEVAGLGVINGPDEGILRKLISDPASLKSAAKNTAVQLDQLDRWADRAEDAIGQSIGAKRVATQGDTTTLPPGVTKE